MSRNPAPIAEFGTRPISLVPLPAGEEAGSRKPAADPWVQNFGSPRPPDPQKLVPHLPAPDNICLSCEDLELRRFFTLTPRRSHHLGWLKDIVGCIHCDFCRLLTEAFRHVSGLKVIENAAQRNDHFVLLTSVSAAFPPAERRRKRPYELVAVLIHANGPAVSGVTIRLTAECAVGLGKDARFHGRYVDQAAADFQLAHQWIQECLTTHQCGNTDKVKRREIGHTLTIVDTSQACLVEVPWDTEFISLSYVWPRFKTTRLIQSNFDLLHKKGALHMPEIKLPKFITDAMEVVRKIGKRYLWVDALCIVQDNAKEMARLISAMDQIYGRSLLTLTIASRSHPSQDYGVPGIHGLPRTAKQYVAQVEGLDLITALPIAHKSMNRSIWASRAWTAQETYLPCRNLVFTDDQMYFVCNEDTRSEDVCAEGIEKYDCHTAKLDSLEQGSDFYERKQYDDVDKMPLPRHFPLFKNLKGYLSVVPGYTERDMTFESDIFNAFRGIMRALDPKSGDAGFFAALPLDAFDATLLWYPIERLRHRRMEENGTEVKLPSWSWAAWVGTVAYAHEGQRLGENTQSMISWRRLHEGTLAPIGLDERGPRTAFSEGILEAESRGLDHMHLIFWGTVVKLTVDPTEHALFNWLSMPERSVPCFTILDKAGDPCGMLPSADRFWADEFRKSGKRRICEFLVLSIGNQSRTYMVKHRAQYFHRKYHPPDDFPLVPFFNLMLVEHDEKGISYRKGLGRVDFWVILDESQYEWERKVMILG